MLFHQLEERARARGITLEAEVAELLNLALAKDVGEAELLAEIRKERESLAQSGVFLTDDLLTRAKSWGRE
jgi:hypothetical protein